MNDIGGDTEMYVHPITINHFIYHQIDGCINNSVHNIQGGKDTVNK